MTHSLQFIKSDGTYQVVLEKEGSTTTIGLVVGRTIDDTKAGVFSWTPAENTVFSIPACHALHYDMMVDLLEHMVAKQLRAIERNEPLDSNTLHPDLRPYVEKLSFGMVIRHPLVHEAMYHPAIADTRINYYYKQVRAEVKKALEEKNWGRYVFRHERAWRLHAFNKIAWDMPPVEFWQLLGSIWTDSENINQHLELWKLFWDSGRRDRQFVMDEEEKEALAALPETVTIHRGVAHRRAVRGLSWTLDIDRAEWFARRYASSSRTPTLATAKVLRKHIIAYFTGRGEREIVVLPEHLIGVTVKKITKKNPRGASNET